MLLWSWMMMQTMMHTHSEWREAVQGVAIKVNGSRANATNFVTFFDDNGIQGRIEGQTTAELLTDPEYIVENAILVAQEVIAIGTVVIGGANVALSIAEEFAAATSVAPVVAGGGGGCRRYEWSDPRLDRSCCR